MSTRTVRRGPKPIPQVRLTRDGRRAIDAVAAGGVTKAALAAVIGFPDLPRFSMVQHNTFSASPLMLTRLSRLAAVVGLPLDQLIEDV